MTDSELGLYIRLLCVQWSAGSLPDDDEELSSYGKGGTPLHRIKIKFKKGSDGRLRNTRMEVERKKQNAFRRSRAENGKLGGRPRKASDNLVVTDRLSEMKARKSSPSPTPSPTPIKDNPALAGEHKAFIEGWVENFKAQFGFDYTFIGGRDGKATKELLATGILRIDLLEIAKKAWKNQKSFPCRQATTIHGFQHNFNQIRTEIKPIQSHSTISGSVQPHEGRNF